MKQILSIRALMLVVALLTITGCASTSMAPKEQDAASKKFDAPSPNKAGLYIYRNSSFGAALLKTVSIDNAIIGATAAKTYFHKEIVPGEHTLATQSEWSDNQLNVITEAGKNYFIRQYIKMGVLVGGAGLESMTETEGQKGVLECNEALSLSVVDAPSSKPVMATTPAAQILAVSSSNAIPMQSESSSSKLRDLNALFKDGIINQQEFETKKREILKSM